MFCHNFNKCLFQVDSDKEKEKKSTSEEETAEVKKEAGSEGAETAGEKDKETAPAKKAAEAPAHQDKLIKDGQLQSAATVGLRHLQDLLSELIGSL